QTIYLKDYRQPDYWIDETHLTFELFEEHALVHSRLFIRRNGDAGLVPLVLDGQQLELVSVALGDKTLAPTDYQVDEYSLTLHPQAAEFELAITTRIEPQNNTALEGLYKSGGMFCTQRSEERRVGKACRGRRATDHG